MSTLVIDTQLRVLWYSTHDCLVIFVSILPRFYCVYKYKSSTLISDTKCFYVSLGVPQELDGMQYN